MEVLKLSSKQENIDNITLKSPFDNKYDNRELSINDIKC